MLRIFATNDHHYAIAPDDLAMLTTRFDRGAYFHELVLHDIYIDKTHQEVQVNASAAKLEENFFSTSTCLQPSNRC